MDPTKKSEIERVVAHIGGMTKARELVRLADKQGSTTGIHQDAFDALRALVAGPKRPPGVFPYLEEARQGVAPGRRELDLWRTLVLLKEYVREYGPSV